MHRTGTLWLWLVAGSISLLALAPQVGAQQTKFVYGEKLDLAHVPNVGKVTEQLYRGAQPGNGGVEELKKLGITTIVDLRGEDSKTRLREQKETEALGMHFVSIPVSGWSPPTQAQLAQFLELFNRAEARVFVHCHFGEVRTGVFVASYRMAIEKWPAQQTIDEMYLFGFHGLWHRPMITFVRTITYREWDVNPKPATGRRDAERIVTGSDGSAYYTSDHYQTFRKIR